MKKIVKVILAGLLLGLMPAPAQALSLPTPCALVQKYPRLASLAALTALGVGAFAAYRWLFNNGHDALPKVDDQTRNQVADDQSEADQDIPNAPLDKKMEDQVGDDQSHVESSEITDDQNVLGAQNNKKIEDPEASVVSDQNEVDQDIPNVPLDKKMEDQVGDDQSHVDSSEIADDQNVLGAQNNKKMEDPEVSVVSDQTEVDQDIPNAQLDKKMEGQVGDDPSHVESSEIADDQNVLYADLNEEKKNEIRGNCIKASGNRISAITHKKGYTAIAYKNRVKVLDERWTVCHEVQLADEKQIRALAFHPYKNMLAIGTGPDKTFSLHIWDIEQNKIEDIAQANKYHTDTVCFDGIIFSPDGDELIVSSDDSLLTFWNTHDWSCVYQMKIGHQHSCLGMSFNSTGDLLAVGSSDDYFSRCNCCFVINIKTRKIVFEHAFANELIDESLAKKIFPHLSSAMLQNFLERPVKDTAIVFHPTNPLLVAVSYCYAGDPFVCGFNRQSTPDKAIQIINIENKDVVYTIENTRGASLLAFNHDGTKIACRNDNSDVEVYDVASGKKLLDYKRPIQEFYSSILFDDKGNVITGRELYDAYNYDAFVRTLQVIQPTKGGQSYRYSFKHINA